jgi:plastocyanin
MRHWATFFLLVLFLGTAAVLVSCGGDNNDIESLATEAADVQPQQAISIEAQGLKFNTDTIVVPANTPVTITLDNQDGGTLHNVSVYLSAEGEGDIFKGELFEGDEMRDYAFTSPEAGVFFFKCDAHPDMNGAFIAK